MKFIKLITVKGETMYVNPAQIVNIRVSAGGAHIGLVDFGFDISETEFSRLAEELGL